MRERYNFSERGKKSTTTHLDLQDMLPLQETKITSWKKGIELTNFHKSFDSSHNLYF